MPEPAHAPSWYPDPWEQSPLRWHDGTNWTGHVHDPAAAAATAVLPPAEVAAMAPHLVAVQAPVSPPQDTPSSVAETGTSGKAIAALVLGLLGIPLIGLVLGLIARRQITQSGARLGGRGMAMAGIVLGTLNTLTAIVLLSVVLPMIGGAGSDLSQQSDSQATRAKAYAKSVVNAVETCSTQSSDGSYAACDATALAALEPALGALLQRCGSPGGGCVEVQPRSYSVSVSSETTGTSFVELHGADGAITKTCTPGPDATDCPTGTW